VDGVRNEAMKNGLEQFVCANIDALKDGIAYIAVGKPTTGKGCRYWRLEILYHESASPRDFGNIHYLINEDPRTILFNTWDSAWAGFDEDGDCKSTRDVAKRIKEAYEAGRFRASIEDVDALMPDVMRAEYEAEMKERDRFINREKRIREIMAKLEAIQEKCDKCHQWGCINCPEPRWHLVKELMCLKFEAHKTGKTT
jgi:hypothetical protein